ncbi:MAG: hypothetical protein ACERKZ_04550 [Lachnotalea sp.]
MKSKVYNVFFFLLSIISLSACSTAKANSNPKSEDVSNSQIIDSSKSDSTTDTSFTEENVIAINAYRAILENEDAFISIDDNNLEFLLNDFLDINANDQGIYNVVHFTEIDMDGDQIQEMVLELCLGDASYPSEYEILHYNNNKVYGYNFESHGFESLKADGTYTYENSSGDVGINKIINWNLKATESTLAYSMENSNGKGTSYFINDNSVVKKDFDTLYNQQCEKKDVLWYEFSVDNISAIRTVFPQDESELALNAYKGVVLNAESFVDTEADDNHEIFLNHFLQDSINNIIYKVAHFSIIDMNRDQIPELVLELYNGDYPFKYEVLHYNNGKVYGYNFVIRGFESLKDDGTYIGSGGAEICYILRILNFNPTGVEEKTLAHSDYADNGPLQYFIDDNVVEKVKFDEFNEQQSWKDDAKWYEFSVNNIKDKISFDLDNAQIFAVATNTDNYYGTWVVKNVIGRLPAANSNAGIEDSDKGQNLIGTSLNFSADQAVVIDDETAVSTLTINSPEFKEFSISSSEFQSSYSISFDTLGIETDSVTKVMIYGQSDDGAEFIMKDSNTIIMIVGNVLFELVRQ